MQITPLTDRIAIGCLRGKAPRRTVRFLVDPLGAAAVAPHEDAAATETRPALREGVIGALQGLDPGPPR